MAEFKKHFIGVWVWDGEMNRRIKENKAIIKRSSRKLQSILPMLLDEALEEYVKTHRKELDEG